MSAPIHERDRENARRMSSKAAEAARQAYRHEREPAEAHRFAVEAVDYFRIADKILRVGTAAAYAEGADSGVPPGGQPSPLMVASGHDGAIEAARITGWPVGMCWQMANCFRVGTAAAYAERFSAAIHRGRSWLRRHRDVDPNDYADPADYFDMVFEQLDALDRGETFEMRDDERQDPGGMAIEAKDGAKLTAACMDDEITLVEGASVEGGDLVPAEPPASPPEDWPSPLMVASGESTPVGAAENLGWPPDVCEAIHAQFLASPMDAYEVRFLKALAAGQERLESGMEKMAPEDWDRVREELWVLVRAFVADHEGGAE